MSASAFLPATHRGARLLSWAEVEDLTGYKQPSKQRAWFDANAIPYGVSGSGRPVVRLADVDPTYADPQPVREVLPSPPPLDTGLAYRPLADIRAMRERYRIGAGPSGSGVYFLFLRWVLVYVGQSVAVGWRLKAHLMGRRIPFNKFAVIEVHKCWLDDVEQHYLTELRPPFNRTYRVRPTYRTWQY